MFAFVARRLAYTLTSRPASTLLISLIRTRIPLVRPISFTPINYNFPNMQQMMDELSKNPKAMAFLQAIKKDPKIMQAVQNLIMIMTKKGYIDLNNPTKQPSLAMLTDSEIRNKLFELAKLLAAAGVFNVKDGANPTDALSNIMGLLMPSSSKDKKSDHLDGSKQTSSPKYDYTFDATAKEKVVKSKETAAHGWGDKIKKIFK